MRTSAVRQSGLVFSLAVLACLVVACGGETTSPPPTPPTAGGVATLTASAGDGQLAAPGSAIATAPVVTARNASGQPVAGATISFAIDSGGGAIAATQATTGIDGTASPGAWTLGATEGANILSASAMGATTIRLRATAAIPTVALVSDATVPRTGGVITVALPGSPFNGLTLSVPDTAFAAPAVISIATKNLRVTSLPAGYAQVGPALVITNSQGTATRPMVMTIPITVQSPDTALATFFVDPSTGAMELLPLTARTATSLTVYSRHFSADKMIKAGSARIAPRLTDVGPTARAAAFSPAVLIIVSVPAATLAAATTTGFQPGRDDWEFTNFGSILEPGGICAGMSISAMYYFYALRAGGTLNGRYNALPSGLYRDDANTAGIRLASVVQADAEQDVFRAWDTWLTGFSLASGVPEATLHYQSLVMAMQVTHMPQSLHLFGASFGHAVIAFGSANGSISFADPNEPGHTRAITFVNGAFTPFPFLSVGGTPAKLVTTVRVRGASAMIDAAELAANWAQVPDESIGRARFSQSVLLNYDAFTDSFIVFDTTSRAFITSNAGLSLRTKCPPPSCQYFNVPDTLIGTTIVSPAGSLVSENNAYTAYADLTVGTQRFGVIEHAPYNTRGGIAWNRFRWITVNYQPVAIAPKAPQLKPDSTLTLTVTSGELAPLITKYVWDFNDGQPSVTTAAATVTHKYSTIGSFKARVTMSNASNRVIAKDSTTVTVGTVDKAYSVWQLDTLAITTNGTVATPADNNLLGRRAINEYNRQLAYWTARAALAASARPTLWFFGTDASINNAAGSYATGLYQSDSLPGSNAGRDPSLFETGMTLRGSTALADDPAFNGKWLVTGTPPNGGMLTAQSPPPFQYVCIGEFASAYYSTGITFAMNTSRGNGTITYTFRDLTPSCTRPNVEASRWTLVVTFKAKRVQ